MALLADLLLGRATDARELGIAESEPLHAQN
jgi:hypothetical protein